MTDGDNSPAQVVNRPARTPAARPAAKIRPSARDTDVIRQDRVLHLVPGMFVLGGRPDSPRQTAVKEICGSELTFRFTPLSGYDLRMLHGIMAMAQGCYRGDDVAYRATDKDQDAVSAWGLLGEGARSFGPHCMIIRTTKRQLAEVVSPGGMGVGAGDLDTVYESLKRLAEVTIHMKSPDGRSEVTTQLLSLGRHDERVAVVLNPRLVAAAGERVFGRFALLSMHHARALRSEAALLLFTRLCGFVDAEKTRQVKEETLEAYIYGDALPQDQPGLREARKGRRRRVLGAAKELQGVGWAVMEIKQRGKPSVFKITRPKHVTPPGQLVFELTASTAKPGLEPSRAGGGEVKDLP